jgi:hypothetical protein
MERLRYRATSVIDLQAELRERALLDDVDRRRIEPVVRPTRSGILRMLFGRRRA